MTIGKIPFEPKPLAAFREETARTLRVRLYLAVAIYLGLIGVAAVIGRIYHPDRASPIVLSYLAEASVCALAVALCRWSPLWPGWIAGGLAATLSAVMATYSAYVGGVPMYFAVGQVCILNGWAVLLPWGSRVQIFAAAASLASFTLAAPYFGSGEGFAYALLSLIAGATTSVFGAHFLDRYRADAFVRTAQLTTTSDLARAEAYIGAALIHVG
jgi:hypothetical protein